MKEKKYIILLVAFVALIVVAVVGYNYLSKNYDTDGTSKNQAENAESNTEEKENSKDATDNDSKGDSTSEDESEIQEEVKALDFEVLDGEGNKVKLSDYYDKPIVINFWATWCGPCKSELPAFDNLYKKYGEEVEFLMVNMTDGSRETIDGVKDFITENGYEFPVYYDTETIAAYVYNAYSIPLSVFIDSAQNVVGYQVGAMDEATLTEYVEMLVQD